MTYRRILVPALLLAGGIVTASLAQQPGNGNANSSTPPPKGKTPGAGASDIELVERLLVARKEYQVALFQLRALYVASGDVERAKWAEEELIQFHRINKQAFRLELDVPPPTLHASYNIPEANELYRKAMTYKDKSGWMSRSNESIDNARRTELLLVQLLESYPQSNKIGDAAYMLGDLYEGKAHLQPRRAAVYFERSFQWNPTTQSDGRLRAARIYDKTLQERNRAIELYREVTQHDTDPKRLQEAEKRLQELSGGTPAR